MSAPLGVRVPPSSAVSGVSFSEVVPIALELLSADLAGYHSFESAAHAKPPFSGFGGGTTPGAVSNINRCEQICTDFVAIFPSPALRGLGLTVRKKRF
jgi:hypothetical protein